MYRPANHELLSPLPYASYSPRGLKLKIAVVLFMLAAGLALFYYGHRVLWETASKWPLYLPAAALPALALFDLWRYRWRWLVLLRKMASPLAHQLPPRQPPRYSLRCAINLTKGQQVSLIFLLAVLWIVLSTYSDWSLLAPAFLFLLLGLILLLRWLWGPRMARCPWVLRVLLSLLLVALACGLSLLMMQWLMMPGLLLWGPAALALYRIFLYPIIWIRALFLWPTPLAALLWLWLLIWLLLLSLRLFNAKFWQRWRYDAARDTFHRDGRSWPQWREEGSWPAAECCGLYLERVGRRPRLWLAGPAGGEDVLLGDLAYLYIGGKEAEQDLLNRLSAASGLPVLYRWPTPPQSLKDSAESMA